MRELDARRGTAAQRGYGANWRKLRRMQLAEFPLCAECERQGKVVLATDVHHIIPRAEGGPDAFENFMSLCHTCHSRITLGGRVDQISGGNA